jgi:hypothetical protein
VLDRHSFYAELGAEGVNDVDTPAAERAGDGVLGVLRHIKSDANPAGLHEVGDAWIGGRLSVRHVTYHQSILGPRAFPAASASGAYLIPVSAATPASAVINNANDTCAVSEPA